MEASDAPTTSKPRSLTRLVCWLFTGVTLLALAVGFGMLLLESLPVWKHSGFGFLTGERWFFRNQEYGAASMIYGTIVVAIIALAIATPLGIGAAIFGSEYLPRRVRLGMKITVELLAGVPSVVYGLLGVLLLRNWIYELLTDFDLLSGDTLLTAGVLLAIMILPTIMTLADDALCGVPGAQRIAARGLGLNSTEVALSISIPQAIPGLVAAVLLALGRAMGETIAVFLVVGRQDNRWPETLASLRPLLESGQTLTSKLGGSETNIAYGQPLHWAAMVGLGLVLLALVVAVTLVGLWLQRLSMGGRREA